MTTATDTHRCIKPTYDGSFCGKHIHCGKCLECGFEYHIEVKDGKEIFKTKKGFTKQAD